MEQLYNYTLEKPLASGAGSHSRCGLGRWNGRQYFIKEFLSPKFPERENFSPALYEKQMEECRRFQQEKQQLFQMLGYASDGNLVRTEAFFRVGTKYYISMENIPAIPVSVDSVCKYPARHIARLCTVIAHSVSRLHAARFIHADIKHDNVLFTRTPSGDITVKLIDFDSGFFETTQPPIGEEIGGDQVYFSPEAYRRDYDGDETPLTCKLDVFALGVLFHQYFTGTLPLFDRNKCGYPGEAAYYGLPLAVAKEAPPEIAPMLGEMLRPEPSERPGSEQVFHQLRAYLDKLNGRAASPPSGPWHAPGNL